MSIQEALQETGVAEAYYDGKTIVVREDENEKFENVFTLSVQDGGMPPYYQEDFKTLGDVEKGIKEKTYFPDSILTEFSPVETEGSTSNEDEE